MRELERQQKEAEENADRVFDMCTGKQLEYWKNKIEYIENKIEIKSNFLFSITADTNRAMRVTPDPLRASRLLANTNNFQSSRRSSEDSLEEAGLGRDLRVSSL